MSIFSKIFQFFDDCMDFFALKILPMFLAITLAAAFSFVIYGLYRNVFNAKDKKIWLKEPDWVCTNTVTINQPAYPCMIGNITSMCGGYNYNRCTQYTEK